MPAKKKTEKSYTRPADQVSQKTWEEKEEARLAGKPASEGEGRSFVIEGHDTEGYVGVSGEYATHASDHTAPLVKTKDFLSEQQLADAERVRTNQPNFGKSEVKEEAKEEDKSGDDTGSGQSATPPSPAAPAAPASGGSAQQSNSNTK